MCLRTLPIVAVSFQNPDECIEYRIFEKFLATQSSTVLDDICLNDLYFLARGVK